MTTTDTDALTERIAGKIRQALDAGEAMQCTRVWEAWHYGTMTDEDFVDASDGPLAEEIATAVLSAVAVEVRKAKAEALREAARYFAGGLHCADMRTTPEETVRDLNRRAAEYETGGQA